MLNYNDRDDTTFGTINGTRSQHYSVYNDWWSHWEILSAGWAMLNLKQQPALFLNVGIAGVSRLNIQEQSKQRSRTVELKIINIYAPNIKVIIWWKLIASIPGITDISYQFWLNLKNWDNEARDKIKVKEQLSDYKCSNKNQYI